MNKEFKKGVIEICVLNFIKEEDRYGYQIVQELEEKFQVKESTIYPILKRLHKDSFLDTYLKESVSGPARKYYKLTKTGERKLNQLIDDWQSFVKVVNEYLEEESN